MANDSKWRIDGVVKLVIIGILLLFLMSKIGYGQRTDTVFQTLTTGSVANFTSGNVTNIGQGYHRALAIFTQTQALGCATVTAVTTIEASYDNSIFFTLDSHTIKPDIASGGGGNVKQTNQISAIGAYPYVRVKVTGAIATCTLDVYYTGTLNPVNDAIPALGTIAQSSITSIGTTVILAVDSTTFKNLILYGVIIYSTASQDIILNERLTSGANTPIMTFTGVPVGFTLIIGNTGVAQYKSLNVGAGLSVTTSAVNQVYVMAIYRYE